MSEEPMAPSRTFLPDLLMTILVRAVALVCLWFALQIWSSLIGASNGGAGRFDLLGTDMKAAGATLAILYPVAAIGLWLRGSWGPVLWTVAAFVETVMHEIYFDIFGYDRIRTAMIVMIIATYLALRLASHLNKADRSEQSFRHR